ncbi:hypothetical protein FEM48_Zijuj05G0015600 [Ziziphus jujuba var. spinosa]|uniref:DUF4220 domain-containing protein n=1 Tax=Ziziphus jujuba var. spinosa TaxID=714518 RepID=A0A978VC13_ZIZJJ|nr:hypothetical protein FEM48_Zijuj05G0015600 [Ziziphus jujuba var. spinosa]
MWIEKMKNFWQRSKNIVLITLLWLTYLTVNWIAPYAIRLISNSQSDPSKGNKSILAFWVSFLLLHLGGPYSITSYSLEDNELWHCHIFVLAVKLFGVGYILFRTFPDNNLWFPTILVLLIATIKYVEKIAALYLSSLDRFEATTLPKPNPGYDYEEVVAKYSRTRSVEVVEQTEIAVVEKLGNSYKGRSVDGDSEKPDDMELLLTTYSLFEDFKGLLVGYVSNPSDQKSSRKFFLHINSTEPVFHGCCFCTINMIRLSLELCKLVKLPFPNCVTSEEKNIKELEGLIFEELKKKSSKPSDAMEACSHRGDWALLGSKSYVKLQWSISEFQYTESLLLWHLATELCYHGGPRHDDEQQMIDTTKENSQNISDYMFYILVKKPELLIPVLGNIWKIVFQDTLEEAKSFFSKQLISDHLKACKKFKNVKAKYRPAKVKGKSSKSVLFDACILASQLQSLVENHWELMSRVWVELLSYSAINCQAIVHAQQLRKGGELLTFTGLLMNHLGLGSQFHELDNKIWHKRKE